MGGCDAHFTGRQRSPSKGSETPSAQIYEWRDRTAEHCDYILPQFQSCIDHPYIHALGLVNPAHGTGRVVGGGGVERGGGRGSCVADGLVVKGKSDFHA